MVPTQDIYMPAQVARRVAAAGIAKGAFSASQLLVLAVMAGAFIALGALFYTLVISESTLGAAPPHG
jgi:formate/nitrite transporter FocA (FNT family)